jgi:hypothetical protein
MGIKVVFITGRHKYQREPTIKNHHSADSHAWEKLMLECVHSPLPLFIFHFFSPGSIIAYRSAVFFSQHHPC